MEEAGGWVGAFSPSGPTGDHAPLLSFLSRLDTCCFDCITQWCRTSLFFFFSGPVLQNDSQPFEKKKSFSKDCQDFEKKKEKKRFKSHVVAVHF